jgi:hypothetical protein
MIDTTALNDPRLSFRAKGLHAYLMTRPEGIEVSVFLLEQVSPTEGREAIETALRALVEAGYLEWGVSSDTP